MDVLKSPRGIFVADYFDINHYGPFPGAKWKSLDAIPTPKCIKESFLNELKVKNGVFFDKEDGILWSK